MNGRMPFQLGTLKSTIYGGPYKDYLYTTGVNMAAELADEFAEIYIPTEDFEVPDVVALKRGLVQGIMAIASGKHLYVGCKGGVGRTGLYLASMAKIMSEYRRKMHRPTFDPILYVRAEYMNNAVETEDQREFIDQLYVGDIVNWWHQTQRLMKFLPAWPDDEIADVRVWGQDELKAAINIESLTDVEVPSDLEDQVAPFFQIDEDWKDHVKDGEVTSVGKENYEYWEAQRIRSLDSLHNIDSETLEQRVERLEQRVADLRWSRVFARWGAWWRMEGRIK